MKVWIAMATYTPDSRGEPVPDTQYIGIGYSANAARKALFEKLQANHSEYLEEGTPLPDIEWFFSNEHDCFLVYEPAQIEVGQCVIFTNPYLS